MLPLEFFKPTVYSQLAYFAGEFQGLQIIVLKVFGAFLCGVPFLWNL